MRNVIQSTVTVSTPFWEKVRNTISFLSHIDEYALVGDCKRDWKHFNLSWISRLSDNSLKSCAIHFITNPWDQDYQQVYELVGNEIKCRGMDHRKFRKSLHTAYMRYSKVRFSEFSERWSHEWED